MFGCVGLEGGNLDIPRGAEKWRKMMHFLTERKCRRDVPQCPSGVIVPIPFIKCNGRC